MSKTNVKKENKGRHKRFGRLLYFLNYKLKKSKNPDSASYILKSPSFRHGLRGQIFSADMMAAIFVFIVILTYIISTWNFVVDTSVKDTEESNMALAATKIADIMVKSAGYPTNWNRTNVRVIGLALWDRTIDPVRLNEFVSMDYNFSKTVMGISSYDYLFRLTKGNVAAGIPPTSKTIIVSRHIVLYNGIDTLEFVLWKPEL